MFMFMAPPVFVSEADVQRSDVEVKRLNVKKGKTRLQFIMKCRLCNSVCVCV